MIIQELKATVKDFFGYHPKAIRAKELDIIRRKSRHEAPFNLLRKLYFGLNIDPEMGCWITNDWSKYRQLTVNSKSMGAHRISYMLMRNPITVDKEICHYCDRKGCVNPFHLFQGSHKENIQDYRMKQQNPVKGASKDKDGVYHYYEPSIPATKLPK